MQRLRLLPMIIALCAVFTTSALHAAGDEYAAAATAEADGEYVLALELYTLLGKQGNQRAQFAIAELHASGRGTEKNHDLAARWYLRAAMQGYAPAQYRLGQVHAQGLGVLRDFVRARTWFKLAADQRHAKAHLALGDLYAAGHGVERDNAEALRWYRSGAALGADEAALHLQAFESRYDGLRWRVMVDLANLRTNPGIDAPVRGRLKRDTVLIELDRTEEWIEVYRLDDDPIRGWVFAELLESVAPPVVTTQPVQQAQATLPAPIPLQPPTPAESAPADVAENEPPQAAENPPEEDAAPEATEETAETPAVVPASTQQNEAPAEPPVVDAAVTEQIDVTAEATVTEPIVAEPVVVPPSPENSATIVEVAVEVEPADEPVTIVEVEAVTPVDVTVVDEPPAEVITEPTAAEKAQLTERDTLTARLSVMSEQTTALTDQVRALLAKRAAANIAKVEAVPTPADRIEVLIARIEAIEMGQQTQQEQLLQAQNEIGRLRASLAALQQPVPEKLADTSPRTVEMEMILAERDALAEKLKAVEEELTRLRQAANQ